MQGLTPMTFDELTKALSQLEEGDKILAGGTDLIIQLNHSTQRPRKLLSLSNMLELQKITITPQQVQIGAMVTMTQIASTLQTLPELRALADAAADVGSPQVRNRATLAGNLCNASPAGDMLPVCWLLGAKIQILDSTGSLSLLPVENFILGPIWTLVKKTDRISEGIMIWAWSVF